MKLNRIEYGSLQTLFQNTPSSVAGPGVRVAVARLNPAREHADMTKLEPGALRQLIALLPAGRAATLHSPVLHHIRQKAKKALLHAQRPHLDPSSWPKVYRMITKLNVQRAGLRQGPNHMIYKLNPKGMAVKLGSHVWDERNAGDLVIMGRWSDITKAIADAGSGLTLKVAFDDIYAGDVNVEFDRMYGSDDAQAGLKHIDRMNLFVSCETGPAWQQTDNEGEVVLDATKEVVELTAGAITGLAGNFANLSRPLEVLDTVKDVIDSPFVQLPLEGAAKLKDHVRMKRAERPDKALFTLTVGVGPVGRFAIDTGKAQLSGKEFLNYALKAQGMATAKGG